MDVWRRGSELRLRELGHVAEGGQVWILGRMRKWAIVMPVNIIVMPRKAHGTDFLVNNQSMLGFGGKVGSMVDRGLIPLLERTVLSWKPTTESEADEGR
jgi:hypothetical protein